MRDEADDAESGLRALLERLDDPDPRVRALAADKAADYFRGRFVDRVAVTAAVARLVTAAVADSQEIVLEATLHACDDAVSHYDLPAAVFDPLVPSMSRLPTGLIGYVLGILGATHDPAARATIAACSSHPDRSVRAEAADALVELAGRPAQQ